MPAMCALNAESNAFHISATLDYATSSVGGKPTAENQLLGVARLQLLLDLHSSTMDLLLNAKYVHPYCVMMLSNICLDAADVILISLLP